METNTQPQPDSSHETDSPLTDAPAESAVDDKEAASNSNEYLNSSMGESDDQMPDPSSLLAMAGIHMETPELIHVLISVFHAHAWRSMGLVADHSGEVKKDMAAAQTAIDCFAFLLGKIEGSLEEGAKRDVQRRLMDLRMNYVAKMREG